MDKRGQVWVETVIYTLIGIAIIGLVLAIAKPKIDAKKDEIVIEQAIESLGNIDDKIYEIQKAIGNRRSIDLKIGNGKLIIDMSEDTISWVLDSSFEYSQEGVNVPLGRINVITTQANPWRVTLLMGYDVELIYNDEFTGTREFNSAPTPYHLTIENEGINPETGKLKVNIKEA